MDPTWIGTCSAILGSFLVASKRRWVRRWGFIFFLTANLIWGFWGIFKEVWPIVVQHGFFTASALLGIRNNWRTKKGKKR